MSPQEDELRTFTTKTKLHFRDADPAGILFFGNILGIAHDIFEDFLATNGIPWEEWFKAHEWACPIRHTEVDFLSPLLPGHEHFVEVSVVKLGQCSFTMHYEFRNPATKLCARVMTTHTFVDQKAFQKMDIPEKYRTLLRRFLQSPE